jgi:hypothetical protein
MDRNIISKGFTVVVAVMAVPILATAVYRYNTDWRNNDPGLPSSRLAAIEIDVMDADDQNRSFDALLAEPVVSPSTSSAPTTAPPAPGGQAPAATTTPVTTAPPAPEAPPTTNEYGFTQEELDYLQALADATSTTTTLPPPPTPNEFGFTQEELDYLQALADATSTTTTVPPPPPPPEPTTTTTLSIWEILFGP